MGDNRAATTRIDALETQHARGSRRITNETVAKFGRLLSERLRADDPTLRTAYLRMLVSKVTVTKDQILISGPKAALENGVSSGVPCLEGAVPICDRHGAPRSPERTGLISAEFPDCRESAGKIASPPPFGSIDTRTDRGFPAPRWRNSRGINLGKSMLPTCGIYQRWDKIACCISVPDWRDQRPITEGATNPYSYVGNALKL